MTARAAPLPKQMYDRARAFQKVLRRRDGAYSLYCESGACEISGMTAERVEEQLSIWERGSAADQRAEERTRTANPEQYDELTRYRVRVPSAALRRITRWPAELEE